MGWDAPEAVFAKMDQNGDGDVEISEFRRWWLSSTAEAAAVRTQKKEEDVKISDATRRLMDMPALEAGQLKGLTAGQLAVSLAGHLGYDVYQLSEEPVPPLPEKSSKAARKAHKKRLHAADEAAGRRTGGLRAAVDPA